MESKFKIRMKLSTRHGLRLPWALFHAVIPIAFSLLFFCGSARATMATVEQRIITDVMATLPTDSSVTTQMTNLAGDGLWPDLVYDQTTTTDPHLQRMRDIARAYNAPASSHYQSTTARDKYLLAFDGWVAANPDNTNWWWKDIGYPRALGEGMLLMRSALSSAQITDGNKLLAFSYLPRSNWGLENTGVNRTDRAYGTMMRAILSNNTSLLAESFLSIGDTILLTTLQGMQPDGSYHQHDAQLYSGGYGRRFATDIPTYGSYAAGTAYNFNPRQIRAFSDWLLDGTQWMLRGPQIDLSVMGRQIANVHQDPESVDDFLFSTKRTITMAADHRASELEALRARVEADLVTEAADPTLAVSGNRMFWRSDYMTHNRPNFMVSVKTASTRTVASEVINGENKKGLHLGDGVMMLYRRGDEYAKRPTGFNDLMPVWDWQRLPGTTVEQADYSLLPTQPNTTPNWLWGTSTHAGGVSDGSDGSLSFLYARRNVSGTKSWFFIGDAIIALGSAINASAAIEPVLSSLNQSFLKTPVTYSAGGSSQTINTGTVTPTELEWVHHDGTGYFFPGNHSAATIRAQAQTGTLFDIRGTTKSSFNTQVITHNVFSLDINHGTGFTGGSYSYVVVPGLDVASMATYPLSDLQILSNTGNIQAVKSVPHGLTLANFFGSGTVDGITVSHSCSIMVRDDGNTIEVTVSDPKQVITGDLTIQIARPTAGLIEADGEVKVDQFSPSISMRVNMAASTGRSFSAKFYTAPTAFTKVTLSPVADSYVFGGAPTANNGTVGGMLTKQVASVSGQSESYLKFDLSGLSGTPVAARLVLHPQSISSGTPPLHVVAPITDHSWSETGLTWNNRPQPLGAPTLPWLPRLGESVRADVLHAVQKHSGAGGELSLWVAPLMEANVEVNFATKENATETLRPTLELIFAKSYAVDNSAGATVIPGEAQLNGWLIDGPAEVSIYWGTSDGATTSGNWGNVIQLGSISGGTFSSTVSSLVAGTTYYYRAYATGPKGAVWSSATSSFIAPLPATVTLGNLSQTYDGTQKAATATTDPAGISVEITYDGSTEAPSTPGTYAVVATINDPEWFGSTSGTLTVAKATPTVTTWPTASGITEGQALSASVLSGGEATFLGSPISGNFVFDAPATTPTAGIYNAAVSLMPTDSTNFNPVSGGQVEVTVAKNLPPVVDAGPDQTVAAGTEMPWTPDQTATRAWYDASDAATITASSGAVSEWRDKSPNGFHITQTDVAKRPTTGTRTINSLGAMDFDGTEFLHSSASVVTGNPDLMIAAVRMLDTNVGTNDMITVLGNGTGGQTAAISGGSGGYSWRFFNGYQAYGAVNLGTSELQVGVRTTGSDYLASQMWRNGSQLAKTASSSDTNTPNIASGLFIGGGSGGFIDGALAEVIILQDASLETRQKVEGYLAHKWGLTNNLPADHPHKAAPPVISGNSATLAGSVSDPEGNPTTTTWSMVSGPGTVSFNQANSLNTFAVFSTTGTYTLRLTADDGFSSSFDDVVITVAKNTDRIVTYDSNSASSGTAPVDGNNPYAADAIVTVLDQGDLLKTGHSFSAWNTAANGTGTSYAPGATFTISSNTTLYAQWTANTYTLTFDANGGTAPLPANKSVTYGSAYGTLATTSRSGHALKGWFTAASGGTQVTDVTAVATASDHTVYAQWTVDLTASASAWHYIRGEAENLTTKPLGYYAETNSIIGISGASTDREDRTVVFGYTLPTLPVGSTLDSATFNFEITQARDSTGGANLPELHAYLLNTADPSGSGTGFYYHGTLDPSINAKRVGTTSVSISVTTDVNYAAGEQSRSFTLTGEALTLLKSYYNGHTPTQSTVYFRFNMSVDPAITTFRRYRVSTAADRSSLQLVANAPTNYVPVWSANPLSKPAATEGVAYSASLAADASDADSNPLTFAKVSGPTWLNVAADGTLSGTPASADTLTDPNSFTVSVSDGIAASVASTLNIIVQTAFESWIADGGGGGITFEGDSNGDGVADGIAWLLGATAPAEKANALLPSVAENNADLTLSFKYLKSSARGTAVLKLQYSSDLGVTDLWTNHTITVPDTSSTVGGVAFVIAPIDGTDLNQVQATVPATAAGTSGKIFVRLSGDNPPP